MQPDHVDDGSKAGTDQKAYAMSGGGREEVREGGEEEDK
jgi:hypothetical protein